MSIATNQSILRGTRGKLGDLIIREVKGKTIISRLPNPDKPQTELQKRNRSQFKEASAFALAAMKDPEIKAYFRREAKKRGLPNPYTAAVSFKLKDLKAPADDKDQSKGNAMTTVSPAIHHQDGQNTQIQEVTGFSQYFGDILDPLQEALEKVSQVCRNMDAVNIDQTQKAVVQSAVRLEIQQTLMSIHLILKANATQFKHPVPAFDHLTALVRKVG